MNEFLIWKSFSFVFFPRFVVIDYYYTVHLAEFREFRTQLLINLFQYDKNCLFLRNESIKYVIFCLTKPATYVEVADRELYCRSDGIDNINE